MSHAAFEQVVGLLGNLDPAELEQVSARVAALRALSSPTASSPRNAVGPAADEAFPQLLYAALAAAMQKERGVRQPTYFTFLRTKSGALFTKAVREAELVHVAWFPQATRAETAALCRIYARCALNHILDTHRRLQWPSIAVEVQDLSESLSHSFPGYARNGMMSLLQRTAHA